MTAKNIEIMKQKKILLESVNKLLLHTCIILLRSFVKIFKTTASTKPVDIVNMRKIKRNVQNG